MRRRRQNGYVDCRVKLKSSLCGNGFPFWARAGKRFERNPTLIWETQLTMVLGAGFGFGVALAVTRLFTGLAPGLTVAGFVAGGLVGLLLTVWVVGLRALLQDRAVLVRRLLVLAPFVKQCCQVKLQHQAGRVF